MIKKIGVELEGGWRQNRLDIAFDRTVYTEGYKGEIRKCSPNVRYLCDWIAKNYPDYVNDTCGLHVHISFTTMFDYILVARSEFSHFLQERLRKWAEENLTKGTRDYKMFMFRLEGNSTFCMDQFYPEEQLRNGAERYTQINFCAYAEHGTVEIRVLPMFDSAETAKSAVLAVYCAVRDYLHIARSTKKTARVIHETVQEPDIWNYRSIEKITAGE